MQLMTQGEVHRTSFAYIPETDSTWRSPYGYDTHSKDKNDMCPYCKNEGTTTVRDEAILVPFKEYYKHPKFNGAAHKVLHCHCCGAVFSHWKGK